MYRFRALCVAISVLLVFRRPHYDRDSAHQLFHDNSEAKEAKPFSCLSVLEMFRDDC